MHHVPVSLFALFTAIRDRLTTSARLSELTGAADRVYVEGDQSAGDPVAEGVPWGRIVIVPIVRLIPNRIELAAARRVTFLVRTDHGHLTDSAFRPTAVLEAMQRLARDRLTWYAPSNLPYLRVTIGCHMTRTPDPRALWDADTSTWYLSSEWECEVDTTPLALPPDDGIEWAHLVDPHDQDALTPQLVRARVGPDGTSGTTLAVESTTDAILDLESDPPHWRLSNELRRCLIYGDVLNDVWTGPAGFSWFGAVDLNPALVGPTASNFQELFFKRWQGTPGSRGLWAFTFRQQISFSVVYGGNTLPLAGAEQGNVFGMLAGGRHLIVVTYDPSKPFGTRIGVGFDGTFGTISPSPNSNGVDTSPIQITGFPYVVGGMPFSPVRSGPHAFGWHGLARGVVSAESFARVHDWVRDAHRWHGLSTYA